MPWEDVKKEMTEEKGLDEKVADKIGEYVKLSGSGHLCDVLLSDPFISLSPDAVQGIVRFLIIGI